VDSATHTVETAAAGLAERGVDLSNTHFFDVSGNPAVE